MTEENKICECNECCKKIKDFLFIAGAVFVGAFLAILLSSVILKPKMPPCPMGPMQPIIVQPMPQPPMMQGQWGPRHHKFKNKDFKGQEKIGQMPPKFDGQKPPVPPMPDKK